MESRQSIVDRMNSTKELTLRLERVRPNVIMVCQPLPLIERDYHDSDLCSAIESQHGIKCSVAGDGEIYIKTPTKKRVLHVEV